MAARDEPRDDGDDSPLVPTDNVLDLVDAPSGASIGETIRPCDECDDGVYQSAGHEQLCASCGATVDEYDSPSTARRHVRRLRERRDTTTQTFDHDTYHSGRPRLAGGYERAYPDQQTTRDETPIVAGDPLSL